MQPRPALGHASAMLAQTMWWSIPIISFDPSENLDAPDEPLRCETKKSNAPPLLHWHYKKGLPSAVYATPVHHAGVVPTLGLTAIQPLSDSGAGSLLLVLHSRLQDTRVRKIY